jgi:hypothetical protein
MHDSDAPTSSRVSGRDPRIDVEVTPPQLTVVACGFLPGHGVTIRVIDPDETANYFQYTADSAGELIAILPTSIPHGTLQISATDSRLDPTDESGVGWTKTATISW